MGTRLTFRSLLCGALWGVTQDQTNGVPVGVEREATEDIERVTERRVSWFYTRQLQGFVLRAISV